MDVFVGVIDEFEYNDEYYYTSEGYKVVGVWTTQEEALTETKAYFTGNYAYLCDSVDSDDLEQFIDSLGLPPVDQHVYQVPGSLREKYLEKLAKEHCGVLHETLQGPIS
jgi:hypothetical protein